jgi:glucuronosyltransferase
MYGDQFLNSAALKNRGMGSILPYENINPDTVYDALKIALDPTTLENARKVSYSYKNRFRGPAETAVYWAEYVAATGGAPLTRSQSIDLSGFVYHSLDIYLTLLVGAVTMLYSWIWFIRLLCGRKTETKSKVKVKSH